MVQILQCSPGQKLSLFLETIDDGYYYDGYYQDGYQIDGYESPVVHMIINPDLSIDGYFYPDGYMPQPMSKFDVGLYYYQLVLPKGAVAVGSYLAQILYRDPNRNLQVKSYQIIVSAPYGIYSATSV